MKQRKLLLSLFLLILYGSTFGQNYTTAIIQGTIQNSTAELFFMKLGEENELRIKAERYTIQLDSLGYVSMSIPLDSPGYYRFASNIMYLSPGDSLSFNWDSAQENRITFTGKAAAANNYLKTVVESGSGSYLKGLDGVQETVEKTINYIFEESKRDEARLSSLNDVSERFKHLERGRIKADRLLSLSLSLGMFQVAKDLSADEFKTIEKKHRESIVIYMDEYSDDFINHDFLVFDSYRKLLYYLTSVKKNQAKSDVIEGFIQSKIIFNTLKKANSKELIESLKPKIDAVNNSQYRDLLYNAYRTYYEVHTGDNDINFIAHDREGNAVNLEDFKGKVIYLEFWATWCVPCVKEFAPLDSLQEEFKDNSNIVILSVSIDKDIEAWKNDINKRQPGTRQFVANSNDLNQFSVTFVPRTIIIGKDFKVTDMHAKAPSDPSTRDYLIELLNK